MKRITLLLAAVVLASALPAEAGFRSWLERKTAGDTVGSVSIKATVTQGATTVFERVMATNADGTPMTNEEGQVLFREDRSKPLIEFYAVAHEKNKGEAVEGKTLRIRCDPDNFEKPKQYAYCVGLKRGATISLGGVLGIDSDTILFANSLKKD